MRVAWVHTDAQRVRVNGEDLAAAEQAAALDRTGVDVRRVPAPLGDRGAARAAATALVSGRNLRYVDLINEVGADVVHLHKWFPWLGRHDLGRLQGPLVATVHNYRPLCPVGTLFRDGRLCTECVDRPPVPAVLHACLDGSRPRSLAVALSRPSRARRHPLFDVVASFIAPSPRAAELFARLGGVPADRVHVVPSFVDPLGVAPEENPAGWLFVGQLERTKGIDALVDRWPADRTLTVVGTGSLEPALRRAAQGRPIRLVGRLPRRAVRELMARSVGLAFPGRYVETQGLVVGEAASVGCPVVAVEGTAGADQVARSGFGVVIPDLEELPAALGRVEECRSDFATAALRYWRTELTVDAWSAAVHSVYKAVLSTRN